MSGKRVPRLLDERAARLDGAVDDRRQRHPLSAEVELVAGNPAHVEQVVHQPDHLTQLPLHHRAGLGDRPALPAGQPQDLQAVADRGQRVAEFVGQGRQELVLAAVGLPQFPVKLGVLDGDGRSVGQVLRRGEVGLVVAATRLGGDEGDDAERLAPDLQRHAQVGL